VPFAPDPCAWVITVKQKKPRQPPANPADAAAYARVAQSHSRIVRVEVEKAGKDRHEVTFWENKTTTSLYVHDGWVIFQPLHWPPDQALASRVDGPLSPVKGARGDFSDLDWIRSEAFAGRQPYSGQDCYFYEDKTHPALAESDPLVDHSPGVRAWIEVRSRLPIAIEDDSVLETFTYRQSNVNVELTGIFAATYERATKGTTGSEHGAGSPNVP
jgi:hypothetical protein